MGTRGLVGFTAEKTHYLTYNHFDSYPDGLGIQTAKWLQQNLVEVDDGLQVNNEVLHLLVGLEQVQDQDEPTAVQLEKLHRNGITQASGVSTGRDFYAWLRDCQGDLDATLRSGFWIAGGYDFGLDSLFCEWGYVIDVDARRFDTYIGFNKDTTPTEGIWAGIRNPEKETLTRRDGSTYVRENYQPALLLDSTPFSEMQDVDAWLARVEKKSERDDQ